MTAPLCFDQLMNLWEQTDVLEQTSTIIESKCLQIENFLDPTIADQILQFAIANQSQFEISETGTGVAERPCTQLLRRKSFPQIEQLLCDRIHQVLPHTFAYLKIQPAPVTYFEVQMTATQDGGCFDPHVDTSAVHNNRRISYVYYFHRYPKSFTGGELKLYNNQIKAGEYIPADSYKRIEPRHNTLIFFQPRNVHEVLPVHCPSHQFADCRFTINGWIHC